MGKFQEESAIVTELKCEPKPLVRKYAYSKSKKNDQEITKGNFIAGGKLQMSILSLHELRHLSAEVSKLRNLWCKKGANNRVIGYSQKLR